jgi:hypothetical protein
MSAATSGDFHLHIACAHTGYSLGVVPAVERQGRAIKPTNYPSIS